VPTSKQIVFDIDSRPVGE